MDQSWKTWAYRWLFNFFPAYRGTGGRITFIARNWQEVRIKLPLNWRTRNYVGTIFGGSIYGAIDPLCMIMLIKVLGPKYIVWDKAASIRFKKPGTSTLFAKFQVSDEEISQIKKDLEENASIERTYQVNLIDDEGIVHAIVEKTLHIRLKDSKKKYTQLS